MQIEEERRPSSGLMLRHGGNDRNVLGSVCGVQQSQRAATPLNLPQQLQGDQQKGHCSYHNEGQRSEKTTDNFGIHDGEQEGNECVDLNGNENAMRPRTLCLVDDIKTHKWHSHRHQGAKGVEDRVCDVQARGVSAADDHDQSVDRNDVNDKNISTPCCNHVIVRQSTEACPHYRTSMHGLHPQVERENEGENSNSFIVV